MKERSFELRPIFGGVEDKLENLCNQFSTQTNDVMERNKQTNKQTKQKIQPPTKNEQFCECYFLSVIFFIKTK